MRVTVLGDFMIDEYIYSTTSRISPEAPVLIADVQEIVEKPGGAGNTAQALINLQNEVQLIGFNDTENKIKDLFPDKKCVKSFINMDLKAIRKTRIVADGHHLLRIDNEKIPCHIDFSQIETLMNRLISFNPDIIVISDYNKGFLRLLLEYKEFCVFFSRFIRNVPVVADLKPKSFHLIRGTISTAFHSILPNQKEIMESADFCNTYYDAAVFWHDQMIADHIIVTRAADGASMIIGHEENKIPAEIIEVVDVCGCGDNVTSVYAHLLVRGVEPLEALKKAVKAATFTAQRLGTHPISLMELNAII